MIHHAVTQGKLTGPRSLLAGLGAGMFEALLAVTPSETIKTKLVDDAHREKPQYRGLIHGTKEIVKQEGIGGIYRGLFPVVRPNPLTLQREGVLKMGEHR